MWRSFIRSVLAVPLLALHAHAQTLTLSQAIERAWLRTQQADAASARGAELDARERVTEAWFAGPPTASLDVRRDLPRSTEPFGIRQSEVRGENEWEPGVAIPLWLPGQRDATRDVIARERSELDARTIAARLRLAGEVREALWAVRRAQVELEQARARVETAAALAAEVERRVDAGDLARTDALMVRSEWLAARGTAAEVEGRANAAFDAYATLVGVRALPMDDVESVDPGASIESNPLVRAGTTRIESARARLEYARRIRRENPTFNITPRFEREAYGAPYRNTVRFGVAIPFGSDVHSAPRIAAASAEQVEAQIELLRERRALEAALAKAKASLEAAANQAALAQEHRQVTSENLALVERAFALGERGLVDVLRVRTLAREAQLSAALARADIGAARARVNQALGVLP